jgi:hypothetical protein
VSLLNKLPGLLLHLNESDRSESCFVAFASYAVRFSNGIALSISNSHVFLTA